MACRRASFASFKVLRSSASVPRVLAVSAFSGTLQAGQRLAKPGLSGFSSNSSEQMAQTRMGNAMELPALYLHCGYLHFYPHCGASLIRL